MIRLFYRRAILPRLSFASYYAAKVLLYLAALLCWFMGMRQRRMGDTHLCIEAGIRGWESIEYKELYLSSCEYLGKKHVHRLVVQSDHSYLKQIAYLLKSEPITHYLYDPRTRNSNQLLWRALLQSFCVAVLLTRHGVVPIVLLTDLSVRVWRAQAAMVSARRGLVICFMSSKLVAPIFPHRRLLGPCLLPFSVQTMQMLNTLITHRQDNFPPNVLFSGSLYEPRITMLEQIRAGLAERGFLFEIKGRSLGSARVADAVYWERLCNADIIVTTSEQAIQNGTDWNHIPHLIYRYLEVLASGTLLVAQDVPGVRRYFIPGVHFVSFDTTESAVSVIAHHLGDKNERTKISKQGKDRADALISARAFWLQVDATLGYDSFY